MSIINTKNLYLFALLAFTISCNDSNNSFEEERQRTIDLVDQAITLYNSSGEAASFEALRDKDGEFVDGQFYVYVFLKDSPYHIVLHPINSALEGRDVRTLIDDDYYAFGQALLNTALQNPNGGWTQYRFFNPDTGNEDLKHAYVRVNGNLVFGSGYYEF